MAVSHPAHTLPHLHLGKRMGQACVAAIQAQTSAAVSLVPLATRKRHLCVWAIWYFGSKQVLGSLAQHAILTSCVVWGNDFSTWGFSFLVCRVTVGRESTQSCRLLGTLCEVGRLQGLE